MIHASLYGRLGKDAQAIVTKSGKPMTVASLAVDVSARDEEATVWVKLVAFGAAAETLARHTKGEAVSAMGRLELSRWVGEDGAERENWQLVTEHLVSARTTRPGGAKGQAAPAGQARPKPAAAKGGDTVPFDDPLPF